MLFLLINKVCISLSINYVVLYLVSVTPLRFTTRFPAYWAFQKNNNNNHTQIGCHFPLGTFFISQWHQQITLSILRSPSLMCTPAVFTLTLPPHHDGHCVSSPCRRPLQMIESPANVSSNILSFKLSYFLPPLPDYVTQDT